ncbi:band 7 protein AGAP004871-like [Branchiostoma floridae x Branchiostoma japonicum]
MATNMQPEIQQLPPQQHQPGVPMQQLPPSGIEMPAENPDWKPGQHHKDDGYDDGGRTMEEYDSGCIPVFISFIIALIFFPIAICTCIKIVQEYERAVIFRLGKIIGGGAKGPGIVIVWPCIDEYKTVDLRTKAVNVAPQSILTRDSVSVTVDAVVYYRVSDAILSVAKVENVDQSTSLLAQSAIRDALGTKTLAEILSTRDETVARLQTQLDGATDRWGVKVERVEIKDVRLPPQLQRAMAAEAEAGREARAKVIIAEGEMRAAKALQQASEVISDSEQALQLRYLQTMHQVSSEKNSTILFPLPIDMGLIHYSTAAKTKQA